MHWLVLACAIGFSVAGQTLLKAGAGAGRFIDQVLDARTMGGLALYGLSAGFYIVALRRIPLSVALPCTALSYFVVAGIAVFVFGEAMGPQKLAGLCLVGIGVVLLATA